MDSIHEALFEALDAMVLYGGETRGKLSAQRKINHTTIIELVGLSHCQRVSRYSKIDMKMYAGQLR